MTPESCFRSLQDAVRRGDWIQCEQMGRLYGWCMLVVQVRRGVRWAAALLLRTRTPGRAR